MKLLLGLTFLFLTVSFILDKRKTGEGINRGMKMFFGIFPAVLNVLLFVSIFFTLVPQERISLWLGQGNNTLAFFAAALMGSVAMIPGFIAYPLGAILVKKGVSYGVVAVFITTLMMVGVLTLPVEMRYFGKRVSLLRNGLSFFGALLIGFIIGLVL